ncbi:MAG: 30S ribosomal protein S18 [Elusimicrobiaceae bacterium]|nr:30S ribosomal protein S18 [Elusimicrobiaceae bacterium]
MAEETTNTQAPAAQATAPAAAPAARGERPVRPFMGKRRFESRRKVCKLCAEKMDNIDYKNFQFVKSFTMESGKILSRRITGTCAKHQRQITKAIKRDRNLAILPYSLPKK